MVKTRLAPSPTGDPHIGTVFQALLDYIVAKKFNGQFLVRIEDTDRKREVAGAEAAIFSALDWFGLSPDTNQIFRQSERLKIYQEQAQKLIKLGHAYYCFCSSERLTQVREEQTKVGQPPMYDRHCRELDPVAAAKRSQSEPHVIRLKVPRNQTVVVNDLLRGEVKFDSNIIDDQVLLKSDGWPTYHLAATVDDHLMAITHVIRGEEWLSSAPKHLLIYQYFNWQPPLFIHTPILRNPDRSKLSKRHGHASVNWYIKEGYLKEAVINFLATRVWNHPEGKEVFTLDELIKHFEFKDLHLSGPIADINKLNWLNGQWLRLLPEAEVLKRLKPFQPKNLMDDKLKQIWPLLKDRLVKLSELNDLTSYFVIQPKIDTDAILKESKMPAKAIGEYLDKVAESISNITGWSVANLETQLHGLQQQLGLKPRPAFMTIRLAVTGRSATPPLFDVLQILGKEAVIKRLAYAQKAISRS